jgi:2-pyrone-4,6-dicarboxylate lactonase
MSKPVSGDFSKTAGWLDWFDGPAKPAFTLAGAVDAHCHVFGPGRSSPMRRNANTPLRRQQG